MINPPDALFRTDHAMQNTRHSPLATRHFGVVIIGRNEGERLVTCLRSLAGRGGPVVYVDSGSNDSSVENARTAGAEVVELDLSTPFTAARARNAGVARLLQDHGELEFIQFVDGDCEMFPHWLETARHALRENPALAAVCGRLRERDRDRSIYNRLADMEWNQSPGPAAHCGGIAMYRLKALRDVGGFDETLIAGEEPELCLRLRRANWKLERLPDDMAWHDIAMTRFSQWWRRSTRAGYVYAEGSARYGRDAEHYNVKQTLSFLAWALAWPLLILALAWPTRGLSLLGLLAYPLLAWRIRRGARKRGLTNSDAWLYGWANVAAKFAQFAGFRKYWWGRIRNRRGGIIEYKTPAPAEVLPKPSSLQ